MEQHTLYLSLHNTHWPILDALIITGSSCSACMATQSPLSKEDLKSKWYISVGSNENRNIYKSIKPSCILVFMNKEIRLQLSKRDAEELIPSTFELQSRLWIILWTTVIATWRVETRLVVGAMYALSEESLFYTKCFCIRYHSFIFSVTRQGSKLMKSNLPPFNSHVVGWMENSGDIYSTSFCLLFAKLGGQNKSRSIKTISIFIFWGLYWTDVIQKRFSDTHLQSTDTVRLLDCKIERKFQFHNLAGLIC